MADKKPNILVIWGDDIGMWNLSCLQPRHDGLPDAEHRPPRRRRDHVHRLLRRAELHRRPFGLHHRPERLPHRIEQGGHAGSRPGPARRGSHHRRVAETAGLRHRPVRQEPPGGQGRIPAHQPRVRRVLRLPLPPERLRRAGTARLPAGKGLSQLPEKLRTPGRAPLLRRRPHRRHRPVDQKADGDHRR